MMILAQKKDPDKIEFHQSSNKTLMNKVLELAEKCQYEKPHTHHVTHLTLKLFDELETLHKLKPEDRELLKAASLLHDIGWIKGGKGHHKTSRDIILGSSLPLNKEEKQIIALVARYHRRNLPDDKKHKHFSDLSVSTKTKIRKLASLLRIGDGLDAMHMSSVKDLTCKVEENRVLIQIDSNDFSDEEKDAALKKADLFKKVFDRGTVIAWNKKSATKGKLR